MIRAGFEKYAAALDAVGATPDHLLPPDLQAYRQANAGHPEQWKIEAEIQRAYQQHLEEQAMWKAEDERKQRDWEMMQQYHEPMHFPTMSAPSQTSQVLGGAALGTLAGGLRSGGNPWSTITHGVGGALGGFGLSQFWK